MKKSIIRFSKLVDKYIKHGTFESPEQEEQYLRILQIGIEKRRLLGKPVRKVSI